MKPIKLIIKTKTDSYPIIIGSNIIENLPKLIKNNLVKCDKCLLLIDKNIPNHLINKIKKSLKKYKTIIYLFNSNEKNKNQNNVNKILEVLLNQNFSRQDCLISIGGGITGDVGGFAASLFKRGLQFINIPTTLLAQVDSSVGGKTGVNTKQGKNLIGSFYQPKLVISETKFLRSLPKREIICGYGEILKHAIISDKKFYNYLAQNFSNILNLKSPFIEKAIYESCRIKKFIVEKDEKEKGIRKVLNFGHTFAHSFEAALGYSKKLNHGEAVILGMNTALKFSLKNKFLKKSDYNSIIINIKKNNSKKINLILLKKIGSTIINNNYSLNNIKSFLKKELSN